MSRELPEWIAKRPDDSVPPRVRVRVFERYGGRCQCGCNRLIRPGEKWDCEDTIALINGGERRESNLKPWLTEHHKIKTKADLAEKSKVYRKKSAHLGIKPKTSRPMPGSRASNIKMKIGGGWSYRND
jgi:5-methylcytosine-specific restriction protein A